MDSLLCANHVVHAVDLRTLDTVANRFTVHQRQWHPSRCVREVCATHEYAMYRTARVWRLVPVADPLPRHGGVCGAVDRGVKSLEHILRRPLPQASQARSKSVTSHYGSNALRSSPASPLYFLLLSGRTPTSTTPKPSLALMYILQLYALAADCDCKGACAARSITCVCPYLKATQAHSTSL